MTQAIGSGAPSPVSGVTGGPGLPAGVAGIDGTTGNIQISAPSNTTQFKKGATPQALQVYEYFNSNTDFARISLNTQTGGPFQLAVETQPPGVIRALTIISNGNMTLNAPNTLITGNALVTSAVQASYFQVAGASAITSGAGVPSAGLGANGDFYFNQTGAALTTIYQKRAGAWVGIV